MLAGAGADSDRGIYVQAEKRFSVVTKYVHTYIHAYVSCHVLVISGSAFHGIYRISEVGEPWQLINKTFVAGNAQRISQDFYRRFSNTSRSHTQSKVYSVRWEAFLLNNGTESKSGRPQRGRFKIALVLNWIRMYLEEYQIACQS